MQHFVLITGCSGGGKSTLLAELGRRGFAAVEEAGRRVVRAELLQDGRALPWRDMDSFLEKAAALAMADRLRWTDHEGWVFFDRGLIDIQAARTNDPASAIFSGDLRDSYHRTVFLAPPWPEIYEQDEERRHDFGRAADEYERICALLSRLDYKSVALPKTTVAKRADFVLKTLRLASPP